MRKRWRAIVSIALAYSACLPHAFGENEVSASKASILIDAAKFWNGVDRWMIEYEATPKRGTQGIPTHRIVAVSAPGDFFHHSAHYDTYPWRSDPFSQQFFLHDGHACHRWPFSRAYSNRELKVGDELGGSYTDDFIMAIIPKWPLQDYRMLMSRTTGNPIVPLDAMRSDDYRLRPDRELIAGEECAIFENSGTDRLWIALHKGICVMRRDIYVPQTNRLAQRIQTHRVQEVAEGIWMPMDFSSQFFGEVDNTNHPTILREYRVRIFRCKINEDVAPSLFTPTHLPGSVRFVDGSTFEQISAGGTDLLSEIVDFVNRYLQESNNSPSSNPYSIAWLTCCFAIGVGMGAMAAKGFSLFVAMPTASRPLAP